MKPDINSIENSVDPEQLASSEANVVRAVFCQLGLDLPWQKSLDQRMLFSCSAQLSTKLILLMNVKMPTIVGILTFISIINTTSERLKARNFFTVRYFSFYEHLKFCAQLS